MLEVFSSGDYISSLLSHDNKNLKRWTIKPSACHSSRTACVTVLGQITFYLENKRKIYLSRREGMPTQKTQREERESECVCTRERRNPVLALWRLFICFFLPLELSCVKLGQPGVLLVLSEVLTPVGPSFAPFLQTFPLSFSQCHSGLLFSLFHLPDIPTVALS